MHEEEGKKRASSPPLSSRCGGVWQEDYKGYICDDTSNLEHFSPSEFKICNELYMSGVVNSCGCEGGAHVKVKTCDLGQKRWEHISKSQLAKLEAHSLVDKCSDLIAFLQQQKFPSGFTPLSPLQFHPIKDCTKLIKNEKWLDHPVLLYKYVKSFGCPNFLGARVQVNFTINLDLVDKLCQDYWDWHLPLFLRFGFPMDFRGDISQLRNDCFAHTSASEFPEHVTSYLLEERKHGAIYGPFLQKPFGEDTHISPFITRNKPGSSKRRVIIDLSWPQEASVNHFTKSNEYMGTAFKLAYPTVDNFVERLRYLGRGCHMMKIDLSRAFRQLKVDPGDYPLLCLQWGSEFYLDSAYAFGHRTGAMGCSRLTDMLRHTHTKQGFYMMSYIDDLLMAEVPSKAQLSYDIMLDLLDRLNIPISEAKLCPPCTEINCLGIIVNSVTGTMSIPEEKMAEILDKCTDFLSKQKITKNQLQSLLGSLMYIHKVVRPSRFFVNRLLQVLRDFSGKTVPISPEIVKDVNWFLEFAQTFNGTASYMYMPLGTSDVIELDACISGLGGRFNSQIYHYQFADGVLPESFSIVHLEMINVLVDFGPPVGKINMLLSNVTMRLWFLWLIVE